MSLLTPILSIGQFLVKEVSDWSKRRDALKSAQLEAELAEIKARAEIAAYKVKADVEWDLKWADQASSSWKDEFLLILWSVPLIGLFLPPTRPFIMEGFNYLQAFNSDIAYWYMAGWAIIFSATYGFKQAASIMLPGQAGKLATILSSVPPDIPVEVAKAAQKSVSESLKEGISRLTR